MPLWQRAQGEAVLLAPAAVANPRMNGERQAQPLPFSPIGRGAVHRAYRFRLWPNMARSELLLA